MASFGSLILEVEAMEHAVVEGGQEHAHDGQVDHAAIQGVDGRKYFARKGVDFDYRAHAGEDHGGVVEAVDP